MLPGLAEVALVGPTVQRQEALAEVAYRAMAAMVDLELVRLEPCFSCLSSDPCGSPLNLWMVTRS